MKDISSIKKKKANRKYIYTLIQKNVWSTTKKIDGLYAWKEKKKKETRKKQTEIKRTKLGKVIAM